MNANNLLAGLVLAASLTLPLAASAQPAPPPGNPPGQRLIARHPHPHMPPFAHAMRAANLTSAQRTQMMQIRQQYRAQHPPHSGRDPQAAKAMRAQLLNVLTPEQRTQVTQRLEQMRAHRRAHRLQRPHGTPSKAVFPATTSASPQP